jgi:hypothetical protein
MIKMTVIQNCGSHCRYNRNRGPATHHHQQKRLQRHHPLPTYNKENPIDDQAFKISNHQHISLPLQSPAINPTLVLSTKAILNWQMI